MSRAGDEKVNKVPWVTLPPLVTVRGGLLRQSGHLSSPRRTTPAEAVGATRRRAAKRAARNLKNSVFITARG